VRWKEFAVREARQTLAAWQARYPRLQAPIPVEDIADLLYQLAIDATDALPDHMAGRLFITQRIMEVRRSDIEPRQRFTIAHEIGHYRLHVVAERLLPDGHLCGAASMAPDEQASSMPLPGFTLTLPTTTRRISSDDARRIEVEANVFAAELLMPAALVEDAVSYLGRDERVLAEHFAVSRQAMRYRLEKLLLIPPPGPQTTFL
jgi:DNA helicase II / ATP-dependent DNA helicase PcrA